MDTASDLTTPTVSAAEPPARLQDVLTALADPVRLEMVRRLAGADGPVACGQLYEGISKSTASHHFKTLREAGLTEKVLRDGHTHQALRMAEVDAAYPGLLSSILAATQERQRRTGPLTR